MTESDPPRDLIALPKAHLHVHLDGAVRESTLKELCAARGLVPPRVPEGTAYESFAAFMDTITSTHDVLADLTLSGRLVGRR